MSSALRLLLICSLSASMGSALGQIVTEDLKVLPDDGAADDQFGSSAALKNRLMALGAPRDSDNGIWSGAAYLFDAYTGAQIAKLTPDDGQADDRFGSRVTLGGGLLIVSAHLDDDQGDAAGALYLVDTTDLTRVLKITPDDIEEGDHFGWSIAADSQYLAAGAVFDDDNGSSSGSVFLFSTQSSDSLGKLTPNDGAMDDRFGYSVDIDGGVVVVGAIGDDDGGSDSGSAYLFNAATGVQLHKLVPQDASANIEFGYSVAISGGLVAVGTRSDDNPGDVSGAVYVFDVSTGQQLHRMTPDDAQPGDEFGAVVDIFGDHVAVSAFGDGSDGLGGGSVYLFDAVTGNQAMKLVSSDASPGDLLGSSLALTRTKVLAGAALDDDQGSDSGSAYLFNLAPDCFADTNHDGLLSPTDFTAWIGAYNLSGPDCDQNADGSCAPNDFTAWLNNYNSGCP
ncbi:MAG: hypothetical protein ED559_13535 [Phycisphaera sp.]|nr:MAG: hypothetical protein ED559_13535 [Phycisphaera sp.]